MVSDLAFSTIRPSIFCDPSGSQSPSRTSFWFTAAFWASFLDPGPSLIRAYSAILQTVYHCQKESWVPSSWAIKCYWACFWITLCTEHVVTFAYWALIYPSARVRKNPTCVSILYNIWTHALPLIVLTVDNFVVAQPARLLHFVYPVGFCLIYLGFTIIYYLAGGVDFKGRTTIYKFLNYSKPAKAAVVSSIVLVLLVVCSIFQYGVYRLRTRLARRFGKLILDTSSSKGVL
ncbi:protein rolling stone isoform X2 [Drosophila kikkawai]|uniref:Protein rolling stone isoform X2 n=1 Tax=Drosophila kikkawai TaxID=30033 RepID=A0ABM4GMH7_DROKI